jgi:hypothetical protein
MLERLTAWWKKRRRPRTDRELAEEEALRPEAEEARRCAEAETAEQRQRIEAGGQGQGHGLGGGW